MPFVFFLGPTRSRLVPGVMLSLDRLIHNSRFDPFHSQPPFALVERLSQLKLIFSLLLMFPLSPALTR